jgi:ADP-ribose pyrophosphatase YjhB (NUDIX family)
MIFIRDDEILFGKRASGRHGAGTWALPGGHVESDETADEAAIRETREELGDNLAIAAAQVIKSGKFTVAVVEDRRPTAAPPVHYVHTSFTITLPRSIEALNQEPHTCEALRWFPKTKLPINVYPPHIAVIRNYVEGRSYGSVTGLK